MYGAKIAPKITRSIVMVAKSHTITTTIITMFVMIVYAKVASTNQRIIVVIAKSRSMMMTLAIVMPMAIAVIV
jgi:hypothetical protein